MAIEKGRPKSTPSQTENHWWGSSSPKWGAAVCSPSFPHPPWPGCGLHREREDPGEGTENQDPEGLHQIPGFSCQGGTYTLSFEHFWLFSASALKNPFCRLIQLIISSVGKGAERLAPLPCWKLCKLMYFSSAIHH